MRVLPPANQRPIHDLDMSTNSLLILTTVVDQLRSVGCDFFLVVEANGIKHHVGHGRLASLCESHPIIADSRVFAFRERDSINYDDDIHVDQDDVVAASPPDGGPSSVASPIYLIETDFIREELESWESLREMRRRAACKRFDA